MATPTANPTIGGASLEKGGVPPVNAWERMAQDLSQYQQWSLTHSQVHAEAGSSRTSWGGATLASTRIFPTVRLEGEQFLGLERERYYSQGLLDQQSLGQWQLAQRQQAASRAWEQQIQWTRSQETFWRGQPVWTSAPTRTLWLEDLANEYEYWYKAPIDPDMVLDEGL